MAVTNQAPDKLVEYIGDSTIDLDGDTFVFALLNAYTYSASDNVLADVVGTEISGSGYVRDTLASVTWVESSGTVTFDSEDPTFSAAGGSITATDGVLFDDTVSTPVVDPNICLIDFDGSQSAGDGTDFVVAVNNPNGWFTAVYADA